MKTENASPTAQRFAGNWRQLTGKIKETWGEMTNDDLDRFEGQMDQLHGHIEKRTGESREDIRKKIDEIASSIAERV